MRRIATVMHCCETVPVGYPSGMSNDVWVSVTEPQQRQLRSMGGKSNRVPVAALAAGGLHMVGWMD